MIGRTNASSGGLGKSTLIVQTDRGAAVTVTRGSETRSAPERYGVWAFPGLAAGEWMVKAVKNGITTTKTVTMDGTASLTLILCFSRIPAFTYTGECAVVDDNDNPITASDRNWKIRFLTSGTLTFNDLLGAEDGIDVFVVGGGGNGGRGNVNYIESTRYSDGGGGGAGGYTAVKKGVSVSVGMPYAVAIGAGGGGQTSAFDVTAKGGGNGEEGSHSVYKYGKGGTGGSDGGRGNGTGYAPSKPGTDGVPGQGTTTREFGEASGTLYAGGGAGGNQTTYPGGAGGGGNAGSPGTANTGGGGGGGNLNADGGTGGSGIVIIRNKR